MTYAVIMAGGAGTRFWPMSTPSRPKQLLRLFDQKSMIQLTWERMASFIPEDNHRIITIPNQIPMIKKELPQLTDSNFILEPLAKNTAPCIGLAAVRLLAEDKDAIMVVVPADHKIGDEKNFQQCITSGINWVLERDAIVTLGIEPSRPETGYGYIQYEADEVGEGIHRVRTFAEKPDYETAVRFIQTGEFLWNSGIFIWSARRILSEIEEYIPELFVALMEIQDALGKPDESERVWRAYNSVRPTSIDYGVMEKSRNVFLVKGNFEWSDIGNWEEIYRLTEKNGDKNAIRKNENIIPIESENCYIYSDDERPLAVVGLKNVIVVSTSDGILVCDRDHVQSVKDAVTRIYRNNH